MPPSSSTTASSSASGGGGGGAIASSSSSSYATAATPSSSSSSSNNTSMVVGGSPFFRQRRRIIHPQRGSRTTVVGPSSMTTRHSSSSNSTIDGSSNNNNNHNIMIITMARIWKWFEIHIIVRIVRIFHWIQYYLGIKRRRIPILIMLTLILVSISIEEMNQQQVEQQQAEANDEYEEGSNIFFLRKTNSHTNTKRRIVEWKSHPRVIEFSSQDQQQQHDVRIQGDGSGNTTTTAQNNKPIKHKYRFDLPSDYPPKLPYTDDHYEKHRLKDIDDDDDEKQCTWIHKEIQTQSIAPSNCNIIHEIGLRLYIPNQSTSPPTITTSKSQSTTAIVDHGGDEEGYVEKEKKKNHINATSTTTTTTTSATVASSYYDRHEQYSFELLASGGFKDVWYIINENPGSSSDSRIGKEEDNTNDKDEEDEDDDDEYHDEKYVRKEYRNTEFVFKTNLYKRDFTSQYLDKHRRDAIVMEQNSQSPYILNLYGYCAFSNIVQSATEKGTLKQWRKELELQQEKEEESVRSIPSSSSSTTNKKRVLDGGIRTNKIGGTITKSLAMLQVATQIARGVADGQLFHSIIMDDNNSNNGNENPPLLLPTVAHADIKPPQFLIVSNPHKKKENQNSDASSSSSSTGSIVEGIYNNDLIFQLNDFNRCRFLTSRYHNTTTTSTSSQQQQQREICPFFISTKHRGSTWRSPEEYIEGGPQTDKIDVFSLGSVLYYIITGYAPFEQMEFEKAQEYIIHDKELPLKMMEKFSGGGGGIYKNETIVKQQEQQQNDPAMKILIQVMRQCRQFESKDRPTSWQVAKTLEDAWQRLKPKSSLSSPVTSAAVKSGPGRK